MHLRFMLILIHFTGIESKISRNKSEFLQTIQHIEVHSTNQNECPNTLAALSQQLSIALPNATFYIFTDSTIINDNELNDTVLQSIQTRAATVRFFLHILFINLKKKMLCRVKFCIEIMAQIAFSQMIDLFNAFYKRKSNY